MGSYSKEIDVDAILSQLTLEEKVSLLAAKDWWRTPVINREGLFVPHIKTTDGPNGARGESYVSGIRAACFPCATNLGSTFDVDLIYKTGREVAKEAVSKSANVLLAPTLNVIRSPLGGRNYETYSEDPLVLGHLAAAYINGCQSMGIAATPKHFVANEAENRRVYLTANVDEQTLREIYLLPFQLVMKLSQPLCFMTSYNRVNGVYVSEDKRLIQQVLRKEWGFDGLVMSDWMGTYSTADALNAGLDLEMPGPTRWRGPKLLRAVKDGSVTEQTISRSARRVLELAKRLGRFENPEEPPEREVDDEKRDEFIRDSAAEGMVLLKNQNNVLPIADGATVAVIGHLAKVVSLGGGGSARVDPLHAVTPIQGFAHLNVRHTFEPGVPVFGALPHADPKIISRTEPHKTTDEQTKLVQLEWFNGKEIGKNSVHEELIPRAEYMIKEVWPQYLDQNYCTRLTFDITPRTSGTHELSVITTGIATCYINGKRVFHREQETDLKPESFYFFKSKLERRFTYHMTAGQRYTLQLDSWACSPDLLNNPPLNGKLFQGSSLRFFEFIDIPKAIQSAANAAAKSDYAVVCVGNTNEIESEGYDRETMGLPGSQYELIKAVAAKNPKTIVVNFSGAPVTLTQVVDQVPAILQAWFPGQECGHSVARVLTGKVNPSGRLPLSWPKRVEDSSSFGNFPVDKHDILRYEEGLDIGYRYHDREGSPKPLFPFGYGLSYTTFSVSRARTSPVTSPGLDGRIEVMCEVENTGCRSGKVVVQFYLTLPETEIGRMRPLKELKAFAKIMLEAGQRKTVKVVLDKNSVSFYDAANMCWRAESGTYTVHVGQSVQDISDRVMFELKKGFTWTGV